MFQTKDRPMGRAIILAAVMSLGVASACNLRADDNTTASVPLEKGFTPLFNGTDLTGWEGDTKLWSAENGEIVGKSPGIKRNEFLATKQSYGDFVLKFRFRIVNTSGQANSGMQFRSERVPNSSELSGYQADVGQGYWGCLYDESRRKKVLVKPSKEDFDKAVKPDDWNEYVITAQGAHITLELNGVKTVDYTEQEDASKISRTGIFALQIHQGGPMEVHAKDIRIKVLDGK
jgi:hypothetical protein